MRKWNPVYRVKVYTKDETVTIMLPITCTATITRSILTQNTSANIQLYNLSLTTRRAIDQPPFQALNENKKYVTVEAGYGDENAMYLIFKGYILQAYSSKQGGSTDIITNIEANALSYLTSRSSYQFEAGTSKRDIIKTLAGDLQDCTLANLGAIAGEIKTATTFEGNTLEQINKVSGGCSFIDNGQLNTILSNEVLDVPVPVITDSNALLQTPLRSAANLSIRTLFEPSLNVGQLIELHTNIEPDFDGQYKVLGFTHNVHFSASTNGERTTIIDVWYGKNTQNSPLYVSGDKVQEGFNKVKGEVVTPVEESKVNTNWIMPCSSGRISSVFGEQRTDHIHNGIDIAVPIGTPIKSVADGYVIKASNASGYGKYVVVRHSVSGKIVTSEYGHISKWCVNAGQTVKQGQIIAYSGNEGTSSGAHLHLTIREGAYRGKAVSPYKYITA